MNKSVQALQTQIDQLDVICEQITKTIEVCGEPAREVLRSVRQTLRSAISSLEHDIKLRIGEIEPAQRSWR